MDHDAVLLEAVRVRRARLRSAVVYGPVEGRRAVGDNVKRLIGSIILAAVICAVCVGVSFVLSILAQQQRDREAQQEQRSAPVSLIVEVTVA